MNVKALVGVGALAVGAMALLLTLPAGLPGLLDLTGERLEPPPELRLLTPSDGEGVGSNITLAGQALSSAKPILDVQYRIDGGRWESAPLTVRGQRAAPFEVIIPVPAGDHVVEARAYDGDALSLPARVEVRRDAPTIRITSPADGEGVPAGATVVAGTVRGRATDVLLEVDGAVHRAAVVEGAWSVPVDLAPGEHTLRAAAIGPRQSLPHEVRVAAGTPAPPSVAILSPRDGAAYGAAGDATCGGGCILVIGTAERASRVQVHLDGLRAGEAAVLAGAWTYRIPMLTLASGAHQLSVRAVDEAGATSVARNLTFIARTPIALSIRGDDVPQPTGSSLHFEAYGADATDVAWTLDGVPLSAGAFVSLSLEAPGDHILSVQATTGRGGAATASVFLHALNRAPELFFTGEPVFIDGEIELRAEANDPDGRVVHYAWDLGDGTRALSHEPVLRHRYVERGVFTATLTATDELGAQTGLSTPVVVTNAPPVANFTWTPERPTVMDVVTLRDTSLDHDGTLPERIWLLPDGDQTNEASPSIRLRERGTHHVTLRVVDDEGVLGLVTRPIVVENLPPEPSFAFDPPLPAAHEEVLFADTSADLDGPIATWRWDFGDNSSSEEKNALHVYRKPGTYTVTLTVADDVGAVANLTRNVTVLDTAPAVRGVTVDPPEPLAQEEARLSVLADDRDGAIVAAHWELGDGTYANETEPLHRYARSGTYLGNVTVFDEAGLNVTFAFAVHVRNAPPSATLATAPGGRIAAFPTQLLANASDPDGRITFYRFDADGDGIMDCEGAEPVCAFVYETAGNYAAVLVVEDDEGGAAQTELLIDVVLPPADHPPPQVSVESPTRNAALRGEYLLRGSAAGPREVVKVDIQLRSGGFAYSGSRDAWRLASGTGDWRVLLDTRGFQDGAYDLVVRAVDADGGVGYARVPVAIQNGERPSDVTLQLVEPPALVEADVSIRASAFHPEGVTGIRYRIDAQDWVVETEDPLAFLIEIDRDALKPGEHVLHVEAYRGVHERTTATHVFEVPGTPPVLIVDTAPNSIAHGIVHAEGRILGEGRAQWRIDQSFWRDLVPGAAWTLSEETLDISNGRHVLHLRAISPDRRLTSEVHSYKLDVANPPFTTSETSAPKPLAEKAEVPALPPLLLLGAAAALALARRRAR